MGTSSKRRGTRVSQVLEQYVTREGEKIRVLPYNFPRFSGKRSGGDKEFLRGNDGKLSKLQHKIV